MYNCTCKNGKTWSGTNSACNDNASKCKQCCSGGYGGVGSRIPTSSPNPNWRGKEIIPPTSPFDPNPASRTSFGFGTSFDGRVRGGIKTPDYTTVHRRRKAFNIFDREHETATNNFDSNTPNSVGSIRKNTGVNAQISRNVQVKDGAVIIGTRVFKTLPDGSVLQGRLFAPPTRGVGKETCSGSCEYKIKRRGLFNNDKFKGSCVKVGDGCKCGQLIC